MVAKNCYLSGHCPYYSSGDNKPPNEHVRMTVPCIKHINDECEMSFRVRQFFGEEIACNIEQVRRKRETILYFFNPPEPFE
tara:strand:+ start:5560 stop:5802 length:243 start_codon:yes stop_codon:yes gene_type:complete